MNIKLWQTADLPTASFNEGRLQKKESETSSNMIIIIIINNNRIIIETLGWHSEILVFWRLIFFPVIV